MKLRYEPQFDLTHEAASMLTSFSSDNPHTNAVERIRETFPSLTLSLKHEKCLKQLQAFQDGIQEKLALTQEEIALLRPDYGTHDKDYDNSSVLFPFVSGFGLELDEIVQTIERTDEANLRGFFLDCAEDENELLPCHGPVSLEFFLRKVLGHADWSTADKCHITDVFLDYQASFSRVVPIMARAISLLNREIASLNEIWAEWSADILPMVEQGADHELWTMLLDSIPAIDRFDVEMEIRPGLSTFTGLCVTLPGSSLIPPSARLFPRQSSGLIAIGLAVFKMKDILFSTDSFSEPELLSAIKLIGDKSKYDILCILRNGPCYGAQLAQKLSLSPATISHHMNALLSMRLIQFDAQENKTYYRLNLMRIRGMLHKFQQVFLPGAAAESERSL